MENKKRKYPYHQLNKKSSNIFSIILLYPIKALKRESQKVENA
jgi:hypothetical protein